MAQTPHNHIQLPPDLAAGVQPSQTQLRRLLVESQQLLDSLDRIESLWVRLQKQSNQQLPPTDLLAVLLGEAGHLFPVVLSAVYLVDSETQEFFFERCIPTALRDDLCEEGQRHMAGGNFARTLRRNRPTVCASISLHHEYTRVRSVVLVPLTTLQAVHGMAFLAVERSEKDITPPELKLLSNLAVQTALALESEQHARALREQKVRMEREVHQRTTELEQANIATQNLNQELETKLAQMQQLNGSLTVVDRVRDGLLATASHELRTPLSAILSSLDIIREEWNDRLPAQGQHLLEICERNSTLLLSLVSDLLDMAALRSGRVQLNRQKVPLSPLIQQIFTTVSPLARGKDVKLLNTVLPQVEVYADAQRLQQVLLNLIGNAIKFSKKESASVRVSVEQEAERVIVSVTDDGVGIPQDEVEHIFEPFVQVDNAPHGSTKGTGLGLAICQSMVEQHGGSIWVESEEDVGSRFSFSLPCTGG